jgi:hypothetical protein
MKKLTFTLCLSVLPLAADEDTFREKFADPATREAALAELIPGTREAYFHTALVHQLAGREPEFKAVMAEWKLASQREAGPVSLAGFRILENRQLLLNYTQSPDASLAELIRRFGLHFDDARPDAEAANNLPTRLDPALVSEQAFQSLTEKEHADRPYTAYRRERRYRELAGVRDFDDPQTRWFLANLDRADLPGVVPLVARGLALEPPVAFGESPLHDKLTSDQLADLLKLVPDLATASRFVSDYLAKLRPGAETDFALDPAAHREHLKRCRDFVMPLPPALDSVKAHVLYHHLRLQALAGNYPQADFLAFLALPRGDHPLLKRPARSSDASAIDPALNLRGATGCERIGSDEALIRDYLQHFLAGSDTAAEFAPYVPKEILAPLHARARLLAGGEPARWAAALSPADFRELQQRTAIGFAGSKPDFLGSAAKVALELDLKNTPDLLVRIYEIDLPALLARGEKEPGVDLDLDGLVPHHQRRLAFPQAPIIQHRERIALPELAGPGTWVVEFVSGRVSARALIRKGRLVAWPDRSATAQTLRVADESGNPVPGATLLLGSERFTATAAGLITIPDAGGHLPTAGVITAGKLATAVTLGSREEKLTLEAAFHVDREQLIADKQATLQLRVRLSNHGHDLPLDRLSNPSLILRGELSGGITTERVIAENLRLKPAQQIPFQVPAGLRKLSFVLRATATPATGGEPVTLTEETLYQLNDALESDTVATAFIAPTTAGHRLELRGRNGEPLPSRALILNCSRHDYAATVRCEVRTDARGCVDLGPLETVDSITITGADIDETLYHPRPDDFHVEPAFHLAPGATLHLPLVHPMPAPDRLRLSLLETVAGRPARDHFDKLAIDRGQLVIRKLPPGDFRLLLDNGQTVKLLVSAAPARDGLLGSPVRIMPVHQPAHPVIAEATAADGRLTIQLRDHDAATRVSLVGRRYRHSGWHAGAGLDPFGEAVSGELRPGFTTCAYLTDQLLSDELRYILDRRNAETFPGSMLPRPGLLLNRWQEEETAQFTVTGSSADDGDASGSRGEGYFGAGRPGGRDEPAGLPYAPVCDFLDQSAVVHFDLTPAADGTLALPLDAFRGCQMVEITAATPFAVTTRTLPLAPSDPALRDRRLARPLDPKLHYQATRRAAYLAKGASATIENLLDADWRAFTNLGDAHKFLYGACAEDRLQDFAFLAEWPDLSEERKLGLLAAHPCHEFHLFLARRDRPFFEKHIKPLLAQKPEPTFIDDYLLERDLGSYLRPYAWARLNAAEQALLAQALPAARERIIGDLTKRWEREAPTPEQDTVLFTQTLRGAGFDAMDSLGLASGGLDSEAASCGVSYIHEKLRRIIFPTVNLEDVTVEEAVDFLHSRAMELDTLETDPAKKGINFLIKGTSGPDSDAGSIGDIKIKSLRLNNLPVGQVLKYICEKAHLRYKVDDYAVTLMPMTEASDERFTRVFRVPKNFHKILVDPGGGEPDPFADASGPGILARPATIDLLKRQGIVFPEGSSATLTPGGLLVTNSPAELDKIEQLVKLAGEIDHETIERRDGSPAMDVGILPPVDDEPAAADPFGGEPPELPNSVGAGGSFPMTPATPRKPFFRDHTLVWREANYYHYSGDTGRKLIKLNRFWLDLAGWDGKGPFLSPHFNACTGNANEALMCLALLDLPFKAVRPETSVEGSTLRVKAREPMLLFYRDIRRAERVAPESPLLVRQSFCPLGQPFRTVDGEKVENPVTGDFRPGVPYTLALTITNPTGIERRVEVLAQIPAGSIPLAGKAATLSETLRLEPHGVLNLELACYFPAPGEFAVYPLHVSRNGVVLAHTAPRPLRVSNKPEPRDAASWPVLAAEGTPAEVLKRLATENLGTIDLAAICWRLKDRAFFLKVTALLRDRLWFSAAVSGYGFHHRDPASIREYLENATTDRRETDRLVRQFGQWFESELLSVRPRVHHDWQTLEFDPLVNPRAHRFTDASRLTHEAARAHYHEFLDQLAWKPALDAGDHLTLAAFLLLQDRVAEGLARFAKVDPALIPARVHYDYLKCVADFYQSNPAAASTTAAGYLTTLPPGLWRDRFQAVADQAAEIAALAKPAATEAETDAITPQLDVSLAGGDRLLLKHRGLERATLRIFSVDLEVLFSKDPFLTESGTDGGQPAISPNHSLEVPLPKDRTETAVDLPPALRKGNLLVAAQAGDTRVLKVLDSAAFELRRNPLDRILQVLDAASGKPLPQTYIKVYAETAGGASAFHKDGYTDLRGKFDYLTHTGIDPATVKRVAILVFHPEKGARTVIYER